MRAKLRILRRGKESIRSADSPTHNAVLSALHGKPESTLTTKLEWGSIQTFTTVL